MRDRNAGYELLRDREHLEQRHPDLVSSYQSFLRDFAQFQESWKQFEVKPEKKPPVSSPFAARLK
ncbi:MAG TPA: hypothetical protein VHC97_16625 [Thermoanaerobaculia bacterium]|nr:hypothetical protein [Thermoanaerobaculia bacterium]